LRIVALAGGTGSAKLLRGLSNVDERFAVIANVGDNYWLQSLYVCPDVDIAMYTLAGVADRSKGWGVERDTFNVLKQLGKMGEETWFHLGDKDLATQMYRAGRLKRGATLTEITAELSRKLGVRQSILPCTDDPLETYLLTEKGWMHLQEFWVREGGVPRVKKIEYRGCETARATKQAIEAIKGAERVLICPANPLTSVMPILSVREVRDALEKARGRRVAISPMTGKDSFSGPAAKLMGSLGREPSSLSVARLYKGVIDCMIVDEVDREQRGDIEKEGVSCVLSRTFMKTKSDAQRLAELALEV
jgi:LPPG:FO 2-phospho-L-lactate transferase